MGCDITNCASLIWDLKFAERNKIKNNILKKQVHQPPSVFIKDWPKRCEFYLMYSVQNVWTGTQNK